MMRRLTVLLLGLLLLPAALASDDDPLQSALDKMRSGDYAEAYCLLRPLAEQGDDRAQFALGWMYHNGYGLRINEDQAIAWWQRAARQDNADAVFALAQLHELGTGVKRDPATAARLYVQALELGSEEARNLILGLLQRGDAKLRSALVQALDGHWTRLGEIRHIRSERANVREGPGTHRRILFRLRQADPVLIVSRKGRWVGIIDAKQGRPGWVHDSLIEPSGTQTASPEAAGAG